MRRHPRIERGVQRSAPIDALTPPAGLPRDRVTSSGAWLGALVLWATLHVLAYNVAVPLWQVPDEPAHVEYACLLVRQLRGIPPAVAQPAIQQAIVRSLVEQQFWTRVRQPMPDRTPVSFADDPFLRNAGRQSGDEPPLYYLVPALVCGLPLPLPAQVHLMRLVSGLFFVLTVPVAWWAVRPVWPSRQLPVAAVAGTVAGLPMLAFLSAGVNNDSLVTLVGAVAFGLLVRLLRRPRALLALALVLTSLLAVFVKKTGIVLVPLAAVAAGWWFLRAWRHWRGQTVAVLALLTLLLLAVIPSSQPWAWGGRNQPWDAGRTAQAAHGGHYGVRVVDADTQSFGRLYQVLNWELLPVVRGQTVRFAAWVRAPVGQPLRLAVRDDRELSRVFGRGSGDWQWLDVVHPVAADTSELRVLVSPGMGDAAAETGVIDVDDASLTVAGGATNLLRNPGLEQGTTWGSRLWKPLLDRYVQPWLGQARLILLRPLRVSWMAAQQVLPATGTRCAGGLCVSCNDAWCWRAWYVALLLPGFWGYFGWLQLPLPLPVYAVLALVSGLAVTGLWMWGIRYRRMLPAERVTKQFPARVARWSVLAVALAGMVLMVPLVMWGWQPQARYLYPVLIPIVLLGVTGLRFWSQHWRLRHSLVLYLTGFVLLDFYALLVIVMPAYNS